MLKRTKNGQIFMNISPQMADISVDNQMANSNTGPYGDLGIPPPLKIKILKISFVQAREDQKINTEPKFHAPMSSNGKD